MTFKRRPTSVSGSIKHTENSDAEVELRKVLLIGDMDHDAMLILTDAPAQDIRKWCYNYTKELENGKNTYFDGLKDRYYVKVLHDSEEDAPENIEAIGYDEVYDLYE